MESGRVVPSYLAWAPNDLPITHTAPIDQESLQHDPTFKMPTILGPQSGVGCKGGLGRSVGQSFPVAKSIFVCSAFL